MSHIYGAPEDWGRGSKEGKKEWRVKLRQRGGGSRLESGSLPLPGVPKHSPQKQLLSTATRHWSSAAK